MSSDLVHCKLSSLLPTRTSQPTSVYVNNKVRLVELTSHFAYPQKKTYTRAHSDENRQVSRRLTNLHTVIQIPNNREQTT